MDLVRIGHLGRAHGVRGEIALDGASLSADELEAIRSFTWRSVDGGVERRLTLESARDVHQGALLTFRGVRDREQAAELTRGTLLADRGSLPDPGPGVVYTFQLVGMRVKDAGGREIGTLADVLRTGAHPVWVVRGEREILVPAVPEVVKNIDMEAGVIVVELPAGLEDL